MSIQNLSNLDDKINITGEYIISENKIVFSFTHLTSIPNNSYLLYINDTEYTKIHLDADESNVLELSPDTLYHIKTKDLNLNNIKMNIISNNRDIKLAGFGKADGIYNYIHNDLYKNSNGYELKKTTHNGTNYWEIIDENLLTSHITNVLYKSHPYGHKFTSIKYDPVISTVNIDNGNLKIKYITDHEAFIK